MPSLPDLVTQWRSQPDRGVRVVAFGSSNTERWWHNLGRFGWVCWLEVGLRANVGKHVSVTNVGICGNTSSDLLQRLERDVLPLNPTLVLITIGGNDQRFMSVEQYVGHLRELVRRLKERNILPVLQTYYSGLGDDWARFPLYMAAEVKLADELGVPCIDPYRVFHPWRLRAPEEYRRIMLDPAHLNPLGHLLFGTFCVRAFGLPDPPWPEDLATPAAEMLKNL